MTLTLFVAVMAILSRDEPIILEEFPGVRTAPVFPYFSFIFVSYQWHCSSLQLKEAEQSTVPTLP